MRITPIHSDSASAWLAQARLIAREALAAEEPPYGPSLVAALNVLGRSDSAGDLALRGQLLHHIAADQLRGIDAGATGGEAA